MKEQIKLFITGFIQVFLTAMNIVFITNKSVLPLIITGFLISYIWTINVRRIAFGTHVDRIIYATGAAIGTYVGYMCANFIEITYLFK